MNLVERNYDGHDYSYYGYEDAVKVVYVAFLVAGEVTWVVVEGSRNNVRGFVAARIGFVAVLDLEESSSYSGSVPFGSSNTDTRKTNVDSDTDTDTKT